MNPKKIWPLCFGLFLLVALYLPHLNSPFLWDDVGTIVLNHTIDHPIPLTSFFKPIYFSFSGESSWRPLATLSYVEMIRFSGKSPVAMRSVQFVAHILIGLMLAVFMVSCGFPVLASAWAAALFWVQPAHVETLMCVSFNEEILVALGLLFFLWFHRRGQPLLAALGLIWAFLSKETAIVGLPLIVANDFFSDKKIKEKLFSYALYALIAGSYLFLYFGYLKGPGPSGQPISLPLGQRFFFALSGFETAIRIFVLPIRLRIEYFALPAMSFKEWGLKMTVALGLCVAWVYAAVHFWRTNNKLAIFFLLWPLGFLALTSNLFPVTVLNTRLLAERWLYLPYLGLAALLGIWIDRRPWLGLMVLLFWSALSWMRLEDWRTGEKLWSSLLKIDPWCAKAWEGLGESEFNAGRYPIAIQDFDQALALRQTRTDRVLAYYTPLDSSGFLRWENPILYRWLGRTDVALGHLNRADSEFLKASRLDPLDGYTYDIMAYQWAAKGDWRKSEEWLKRGLSALPKESFLLRLKPDVEQKRLSFQSKFY